MGLDLSSFGNLTSNLGSVLPSGSAIAEQVLTGAAASVVLTGLKNGGAASLDPLGLFHKDPANNPNATIGPTITASAFASLPAASQGALLAAGCHVIAG